MESNEKNQQHPLQNSDSESGSEDLVHEEHNYCFRNIIKKNYITLKGGVCLNYLIFDFENGFLLTIIL